MRKFFKDDPGYNKDFYKKGVYEEPLHHIENEQSRMRLLIAKAMFEYVLFYWGKKIRTHTDLGCGDGGLLEQLYKSDISHTGIDISEANIKYAQERLKGKQIKLKYEDFTELSRIKSDVITICETLEHLTNPIKVLKSLDCKYLIASVPLDETQELHSEFHLWGWNMSEFAKTITSTDFNIISHVRHNQRTQLVLAEKKK